MNMQCCLCLISSLKYFVTCHIPPQKENHMHRDSTYNIMFTVCLSMLFKSDRVFWHDLGCLCSPHHLWMLISLLPARGCLLLTPQSRGCQACHIHLMYGWERERERTARQFDLNRLLLWPDTKRAYVLEKTWQSA